MRKLIIAFILSLAQLIYPQNIVLVEYFINSDPGFGYGTQVNFTPGVDVELNFDADLSGLDPGMHRLFIRAKDEDGHWSIPIEKGFEITEVPPTPPNIGRTEYFIDSDPGFGFGTHVSITPGVDLELNFDADLNGLNPGMHRLFVRAKDQNGRWSIPMEKRFEIAEVPPSPPNIAKTEYFIDNDPGFGFGTQVSITPGVDLELNFDVDLSGIDLGMHRLFVRAKDQNGRWSIPMEKRFELAEVPTFPPNITFIEYYLEQGGELTEMYTFTDFTPAESINVNIVAGLAGLPGGTTNLHLYGIDETNTPSLEYVHEFELENPFLFNFTLTETATLQSSTIQSTLESAQPTFGNIVVSGDLSGVLDFNLVEKVQITDGPFAGSGFMQSEWTATIESAEYQGDWKVRFYYHASTNEIVLKGTIEGEIRGICSGSLTESTPESGVYDQYNSTWKLTRVGDQDLSATMSLEGTITDQGTPVEYPSVSLRIHQLYMSGSSDSEHYTGPLSGILTQILVEDTGNPYHELGISTISYQSDQGSGEGWTVDEPAGPQDIWHLRGQFEGPLAGIITVIFDKGQSPRILNGYREPLDIYLSPMADLEVDIWGPTNISPGQTVDYTIEYNNRGVLNAENVVIIQTLPVELEFQSSSGVYRWDTHEIIWKFNNLPPKSNGYVNATVEAKWGLSLGDTLNNTVRAGTTSEEIDVINDPESAIYFLQQYLEYNSIDILNIDFLIYDELELEFSDLNFLDLFNYTKELGFVYIDVTLRVSLSNQTSLLLVFMANPEDPSRVVMVTKKESPNEDFLPLIVEINNRDVSFFNRSGGMVFNENNEITGWGEWNEAQSLKLVQCIANCIVLKSPSLLPGLEILRDLRDVIGAYQSSRNCLDCLQELDCSSCASVIIVELTKRFLSEEIGKRLGHVFTIAEMLTCLVDCNLDPNSHLCEHCNYNYWCVPGANGGWKIHCLQGGYVDVYLDPFLCGEGYICRSGINKGCTEIGKNIDIYESIIQTARDPNEKLVNPEYYIQPGEIINYTINYENEGEGIAFGVYITDELDEDIDDATLIINNEGTFNPDTRTITWYIGQVDPHQTGSVTFSAEMVSDAEPGTEIINYATVYFPSVPEVTRTNGVVSIYELPLLAIDPANRNVGSLGGQTTFNITSNVSWNVNEGEEWLNVTPVSGNGNGILTADYNENTTMLGRIGTITVSGDGITREATVTQKGATHFTYNPTANYYVICIESATLDDQTIESGDEIGVFFQDDNNELICAGATVWPEDCFDAWGDDLQTPIKDGFSAGEELYFKLWDSSDQEEIHPPVTVNYVSGDGTWGNGPLAEIDLMEFGMICSLSLDLNEGWNWISSNVYPPDPDVETIWTDTTCLEIVKGYNGFYVPGVWNGIGDWDISQMYSAYLSCPVSLMIEGECVDPALEIELDEEWNWVSYFPAGPINAEIALASITDNLNIAKAYQGFYVPGIYNGIGDMQAGQGYKLHTSQACTLIYPTGGTLAKRIGSEKLTVLATDTCTYYNDFKSTEEYQALLIQSIDGNGIELESGDELGIFTEKGLGVGGIVLTDHYPLGLMAWKDDPRTDILDGFEPGETMMMKYWDASEDINYKAIITVEEGSEHLGGAVLTKVSLEVDLSSSSALPTAYSLAQNYPNPFNPTTKIKFALPEEQQVQIKIYDIIGQVVDVLIDRKMKAGYHEVEFNAQKFASGVYFYRMNAGDFVNVKKMVVLK